MHTGAIPALTFETIGLDPFQVLGATVLPVRLHHGPFVPVLGFRFGNVAYCTDVNAIPAASMERLAGLDVLILDCLRREPHATHFSLDEALDVWRELRPKRLLLTHRGSPIAVIAPLDTAAVERDIERHAERAEELAWLAVSESAFDFWDNAEDDVWDHVAPQPAP